MTIPTDAKQFERWLNKRRADLPPDLLAKAERALLTFKTLDQPNVAKCEAFMRASADDLKAFADACASHDENAQGTVRRGK